MNLTHAENQEKNVQEIYENQIEAITANTKSSLDRIAKAQPFMGLAEKICNDYGKFGNPSYDNTEERACNWEIGWGSVRITVSLGLSKDDEFKDVIKYLAGLEELKDWTLKSNQVFDSYISRIYILGEDKIAFNLYPSKVPEALCRKVKQHEHGPEYKLVCDKSDILNGEVIEEIEAN